MMLQKLTPTCFHRFLVVHKDRKIGVIHISCDIDLLSPLTSKNISFINFVNPLYFLGPTVFGQKGPEDCDEFFVCVSHDPREWARLLAKIIQEKTKFGQFWDIFTNWF